MIKTIQDRLTEEILKGYAVFIPLPRKRQYYKRFGTKPTKGEA